MRAPEARSRRRYAHPSAARVSRNGHGADARPAPARSRDVRIGARLRALRLERRVPLTALSRQAGLSPGYLSQVENDLAMPSTTALGRLAEVLEVPLSSFFEPSGGRLPENY